MSLKTQAHKKSAQINQNQAILCIKYALSRVSSECIFLMSSSLKATHKINPQTAASSGHRDKTYLCFVLMPIDAYGR